MQDLSIRQRQQLIHLKQRLLFEGNLLVKQNKTLKSILLWAEQEYVSLAGVLFGEYIQITAAWIDSVEQALLSQGYAPLVALAHGDRIAHAQQSVTEHKAQAIPPRYFRVLLSAPSGQLALPTGLLDYAPWQCIDEDWRSIDLTAYTYLVVVENLTLFYRVRELNIEWPQACLVIYRGDRLYHSGSSQMIKAWQHAEKPIKAMLDIDGFSLRLAQSRGYSHIAMPSLARLQVLANAAHAPPKQHAYLSNLSSNGGLSDYVHWLQTKQVGLKQEWMYQERLYWVQVDG